MMALTPASLRPQRCSGEERRAHLEEVISKLTRLHLGGPVASSSPVGQRERSQDTSLPPKAMPVRRPTEPCSSRSSWYRSFARGDTEPARNRGWWELRKQES